MAECICKVVDAAISPLVSLVTEHLTYLLKVEDNLDELKNVAAELAARRKDVDERIRSGCRTTGGTATNEVSEWLQGADSIVARAEALHRRYAERTRCLGGCSVEFWSTYAAGKTAAKMIPDARREFDRGVLFQQVVNVSAGRWLESGHGRGGKTHLLKSINNSFARQTSFDVVIFVTASRSCSVARIQSEIVNTLGLTAINNVQDQARIISDFLREKNFLLLLDDLWERLDLGAVGVPMPSAAGEQLKRKVVLTTRFLKVCGQMGDFCIAKNDLILCLLGLGVIDGFDDMRSAYNIGYDLIASLRSACLLNDDLGFGVRVHDVIRDMALWIACDCGQRKKKWFVKAGLGLTEVPPQGTGIVWGETDRVSLMHNRIKAFHDSPGSSSPAALTTLILQGNLLSEISLAASPSLAALAYLDLSHNRLNGFPENICRLTALRYLNLSFNEIRNCLRSLNF
ncbi:putative disease resistance protein [Ananas comosus]|uniref:Putative disease resistance protein n=1 Tax=Ananas comosus TaxID=4615 RepID=A0A199VDT1_ANACO|nr:putative disease resistance protein [Ananas comosus]